VRNGERRSGRVFSNRHARARLTVFLLGCHPGRAQREPGSRRHTCKLCNEVVLLGFTHARAEVPCLRRITACCNAHGMTP